MRAVSNISLLSYNTFGMDVKARLFIEYYSLEELRQVLKEHRGERILHIGQGSNLLFTKDFDGVILHSGMARARFLDDETVEAQNGLRLDDLIAQLTDMCYCGMEKLSLIPGEVPSKYGINPFSNMPRMSRSIFDSGDEEYRPVRTENTNHLRTTFLISIFFTPHSSQLSLRSRYSV